MLKLQLSKPQKKALHGSLIGLSIFILISGLFSLNVFKEVEWLADDFKMEQLRQDTLANKDIIILLVDESSLSSMDSVVGRWPWPRSVWADLLEYLSMGEAEAVVFDILFTERSLNKQKQLSEHDKAFAEITKEAGMVTQAIQLLNDPENPDADRALPKIFDQFAIQNVKGIPASNNNTFYIPFKQLGEATKYVGVVEFAPDDDGVYRRTKLFRDYQNQFYPVLSIAGLMERLDIKKVYQNPQQNKIWINDLAIPLDRQGHFQVNFYGNFATYSVASVLASLSKLKQGDIEAVYTDPRLIPPDAFKDKIIFIGTSAVGLEDMKSTPIDSRWPGVFLHASIAANLLDQDFIYQINAKWVFAIIFLLAFLTVFLVLLQSSIWLQAFYPALILSLFSAINLFSLQQWSLQIDFVPPALAIFLAWLLSTAYLSATEGREKKRVRNMLAQYVSPAALESVLDDYEGLAEAEVGKEEEMSIVFSDVRGFTTISESLKPVQVVKMLNIHLEEMTQVTFKHGGTMDKFIGDATMAFWGAPLADKQHALHATQAAIEMFRAMKTVNLSLQKEGIKPISIGVGVNTGRVILGNIGSSQKLDYTVIGDAVNLGARLEGLTKQYGVGVLISEFTQQNIHQQIPCALVDMVRVKGKQEPVKIYTPLASIVGDIGNADLAQQLLVVKTAKQAFDLYQAKQFSQAIQIFNQLPDEMIFLKKVYQQRCKNYLTTPPEDNWDGVYTLTTK